MQSMSAGNGKQGLRRRCVAHGVVVAVALAITGETVAQVQGAAPTMPAATVDDARLLLGKWIETQQIVSRERKDWQQGKEILLSRVELVKKEVTNLDERIQQAEVTAAEGTQKRTALLAENDVLKAADAQLAEAVTRLENEVRRLFKIAPEPLQQKLQPVFLRMPEDPAKTKASVAERFQNVLLILKDLNKANQEIAIHYEVRELQDGKRAEVRALYVGLAQAYYVSASGEAGIGRPSADGWTWEPANSIAGQVRNAIEIRQGKQSAAFVPLPVRIQ